MVIPDIFALAKCKQPIMRAGHNRTDLLQRIHQASTGHPDFFFRSATSPSASGFGLIRTSDEFRSASNDPVYPSQFGKISRDPRAGFEHGRPSVPSNHAYRDERGSSACPGSDPVISLYPYAHQAATDRETSWKREVDFRGTALLHNQALTLIKHVKDLLQQEKIHDARHALELGSIRFPDNHQIVKMLRAISPGRASTTDHVSSGCKKEMAWIKQHGSKYRGQWIALDEDRLVSSAPTLKILLTEIVSEHDQGNTPLVQYLLPEPDLAC